MQGINPEALRQALIARQMAISPQEPEQIDPAMVASLEGGNQPPPDMGGAPEGAMGMPMGAAMDPAVQMEMERAQVKEMLKRVREKELGQELEEIKNSRLQDIENESREMFE